MSIKQNFIDYEERERKGLEYLFENFPIFKEVMITDIEGYNYFDAVVSSGDGINLLVEVKVRSFKHTDFDDFYIDKKKIDNLIMCFKELKEDYNLKSIYYFSFFPESWTLLIWDVLNTPIKIGLDIEVQKSQAGNKYLIKKDMFLFHKKYAEVINLKK